MNSEYKQCPTGHYYQGEKCGRNFATDWTIFKNIEKGYIKRRSARDRVQSYMSHLEMQAK